MNTLLPRFLPNLYHSLYTKVSRTILVKLENKQDRRTIEETMAERRAKKLCSSSTTVQSTEDIVTEPSLSENTAQSTSSDSGQTTT